jgi:hypothetical protein
MQNTAMHGIITIFYHWIGESNALCFLLHSAVHAWPASVGQF